MIELSDKDRLRMVLESGDGLAEYLRDNAYKHHHYKYYSTIERVEKIVETQSIFLSKGENWNDIDDARAFNREGSSTVRFGGCFSFSASESVAMWMLYGGSHAKGAMIDFGEKSLRDSLKIGQIELGYLTSEKKFEVVQFAPVGGDAVASVYLTDILYYGKGSGDAFFSAKRSDTRVDGLVDPAPSGDRVFIKSYPWNYENEVRLVVEVRANYVKPNVTHARLPIRASEKQLRSRVFVSPNYEGPTNGLMPSNLKGRLFWDLCRNCNKR